MENLHRAFDPVRQFDAEHGDSIREGNWFYFEDGARREAMIGGMGALYVPEACPRQRWKGIVYYNQLKLQRYVQEFDPLAEQLQVMLDRNLDAHLFDAKLARAEELQMLIRRQKRKLDEAQEELRKHEPGYQPPESTAAFEAALQANRDRRQTKLNKLKV